MFQIAMSLLKCFESSMLELDLEGVSGLLKKWRAKSQEFNDLTTAVTGLNQGAVDNNSQSSSSLVNDTEGEDASASHAHERQQTRDSCWVDSGGDRYAGRGGGCELSRSFSLPASVYESHMSYEEIMRHVELMPINNESLQKLQETFALEMISMSEMTLKLPPTSSGSGMSEGDSRSSKPGSSYNNTPNSHRVESPYNTNENNNNNRQLIKQSGKVFSTAASVAASSSISSSNNSGNNILRSISGSAGSDSGGGSANNTNSGGGGVSASLPTSKWLERYGDMISQDDALEMIR